MLPSSNYALSQQNLPEITLFSQDNTICKTCGISYMIYNNMKDQLESYRVGLQNLKEFEYRERTYQDTITVLKNNLDEISRQLNREKQQRHNTYIPTTTTSLDIEDQPWMKDNNLPHTTQ